MCRTVGAEITRHNPAPSLLCAARYGGQGWNLLNETDLHRFELGTTSVWGSDNPYAWPLGGEITLASEAFEFKLTIGFIWYF